MKAGEARAIAKDWVEREARLLPGFHGAHLSGSLTTLAEEDEFPGFSDIDIYCIMEDDRSFPQRKFLYRDALLETVAKPLSEYRSPEAVLSHPFLAHNFRHDCVLADSEEILHSIHLAVKERFAEPEWLQARYAAAKTITLSALADTANAESMDVAFGSLFRILRLLSNLVLIASLQAPTVRRALCEAKALLTRMESASLSEEMLHILGCADFTRERTRLSLDECVKVFDRAVEVYRTPFIPGFNLTPAARPYLIEGAMEMIRSGDHREAMLWIAAMHWTANRALQNDAPESERSGWRDSMNRLYSDLGLKAPRDFSVRLNEANAVAKRLIIMTDNFIIR